MRELFDHLPRKTMDATNGALLLDTCFIISLAERRELKRLREREVAVTSFNIEELEHVSHRLHDKTKEELRHFFKKAENVTVIDVPVHPGDREGEKIFVNGVDPRLLQDIPDPSDAVLAAAAFVTKSDILTKDKHHLFTTKLENLFNEKGIHVWKEWKDALVNHP